MVDRGLVDVYFFCMLCFEPAPAFVRAYGSRLFLFPVGVAPVPVSVRDALFLD